MTKAAGFTAMETLKDGRRIEIRALRPEDRDGLIKAVARVSAQSLYRRFFAIKRHFTDEETHFFLDVDFANHVALVAEAQEGSQSAIIGGARYIMVEPGRAEVAFAVVDQYQGQGLGGALMRHLTAIAREAGLREFIAEVLPDNAPMLRVFKKSGLNLRTKRESGVTHVLMQLA